VKKKITRGNLEVTCALTPSAEFLSCTETAIMAAGVCCKLQSFSYITLSFMLQELAYEILV